MVKKSSECICLSMGHCLNISQFKIVVEDEFGNTSGNDGTCLRADSFPFRRCDSP